MRRAISTKTSVGDETVPARSLRDTPTSGSTPAQNPTQSNKTGTSGSMGFVMGAINSAIALVKNPAGYMAGNKDARATTNEIILNYVAVLAAIPFVATLIGDLWYYSLFIPHGFVGSFVAYAFTNAILSYILSVIGVYIVGLVIGMLAPSFKSSTDKVLSLKLAAFIFTPVFLIGVLDIIPFLAVLTIVGVLYGLYILYLGLPVMLGTPKESVVTYLVAVVVATLIVYLVMGAIVGAVSAAVFHVGMGFL